MELKTLVAQQRSSLRLNQEMMAKKLKISRSHYNKIEKGKQYPTLDLLDKIAKLTDSRLVVDIVRNDINMEIKEVLKEQTVAIKKFKENLIEVKPTDIPIPKRTELSISAPPTKFGKDFKRVEPKIYSDGNTFKCQSFVLGVGMVVRDFKTLNEAKKHLKQ